MGKNYIWSWFQLNSWLFFFPYRKQYEKDELEYVQTQKNYAFPEDKISRGMKLFKSRQTTLDFDTEKHLSKDEIVSPNVLEQYDS